MKSQHVRDSEMASYDTGAHLVRWDVRGRPVIWLSERAVLDGSAPIRGGIPICFPWFAAGPEGDLSPSHGLARTASWRPADVSDGQLWAWELDSDEVTGAPGAHHLDGPFFLRYAVSLLQGDAAPALRVELTISNPAQTPLLCEAALHTYLAVADVGRTTITGLDGAAYLDKVRQQRARQEGPLRWDGAIDNVYDSPGAPCVSVDDGQRVIDVHSFGATQSVIWNPGPEAAATMSDVGDEAWRRFVCVEAAATADQAVRVEGSGSHRLGCTITVHEPVAT